MRAREKNNNRSEENNMDINQKLTEELEVKRWQVDAAVNLLMRETPFLLFQDTGKRQRVRWMMSSCESCTKD